MKAFVYLEGPLQNVPRWGTKCRKRTTYEWELPDVTMGAFTTLRIKLSEHLKSGLAESVETDKEEIDGERVNVIRVKLRKAVMRGTPHMINTAVKQALKQH